MSKGFSKTIGSPYPPGYINGFYHSHDVDSDHDIYINAGTCRDQDNSTNMELTSTITKQIDAAWSVGDDAGGMDTGSVTADTTYHLWLIKRSDTGVVDVCFSTSASSPTLPTNYDSERRIGVVVTDATSNIKGIYLIPATVNRRITYLWTSPEQDLLVTSMGTTATQRVLNVPTGVEVLADVRVSGSAGSDFIFSHGQVSPGLPGTLYDDDPTADVRDSGRQRMLVWTNGSAQIYTRAEAAADDFAASTLAFTIFR